MGGVEGADGLESVTPIRLFGSYRIGTVFSHDQNMSLTASNASR